MLLAKHSFNRGLPRNYNFSNHPLSLSSHSPATTPKPPWLTSVSYNYTPYPSPVYYTNTYSFKTLFLIINPIYSHSFSRTFSILLFSFVSQVFRLMKNLTSDFFDQVYLMCLMYKLVGSVILRILMIFEKWSVKIIPIIPEL